MSKTVRVYRWEDEETKQRIMERRKLRRDKTKYRLGKIGRFGVEG